jgi:hypothetical protein
VPREAIDTVTSFDTAILGTPALRAEINGPNWQNFFSSIQISFGRVEEYDAGSIDFQEDPQGWRGRNHMMISFLAPTWMLLLDSEDVIKISLDIQSTPGTTALIHKFGTQLKIYEATLGDRDHVIITSQLPRLSQMMLKAPIMIAIANNLNETIDGVSVRGPEALFQSDCKAIKELKFLLNVEDDSRKATLAVRDTAVEATQEGPCSILVTFGGWSKPFIFPFPVNVACCKLRISRKQSYIEVRDSILSLYRILTIIEVLVPPWAPLDRGGYSSIPFPASISEHGPIAFNVPKLHLDALPKLQLGKKRPWLETHAAMTLSARERQIRHPTETSQNGLLNVKENLHALFVVMSASSSPSGETFGLCHPQKGGIYTLILVSSVHLDLSAQTVVADAHIMPLFPSMISSIGQFLRKNQKNVRSLLVSDEGLRIWSDVLAMSVERCRGGVWEHNGGSCEYKKLGKFPASAVPEKSPLCGCGMGKASAAFARTKAYKTLLPYVTRGAIGPIFTVPFYEQLFTGS